MPKCKEICSAHPECAAFVHRITDDKCGYWKKEPLNIQHYNEHNCYQKTIAGKNEVYLLFVHEVFFIYVIVHSWLNFFQAPVTDMKIAHVIGRSANQDIVGVRKCYRDIKGKEDCNMQLDFSS